MEYDIGTALSDVDTTAMKVSYTVSDELSISYAQETIEREGTLLMQNTKVLQLHIQQVV
jgi:hypothetical protein